MASYAFYKYLNSHRFDGIFNGYATNDYLVFGRGNATVFAGAGDECPGVRVFERLAGRDAEFVGFSGGNFHIAYTTWVMGADIVPFRQDAGKQKELLWPDR